MAINIGFAFPNFKPTDISKIVNRAPPQALDLI
jgi:hypothetical protein